MKKIVFVTASPETISCFLLAYINELAKKHDIHVATTLPENGEIRGLSNSISVHNIYIARSPKVIDDIKSLYRLSQFLRQQKFDVVHSFTPKAGLISQISAFLVGVPIRFHTFTGQVWATQKGIKRWLLKHLDKVTATLATFCLVDGPAQRSFLIDEKLLTLEKSEVLAQGSLSGVNLSQFSYSESIRGALRKEHHIAADDFVFLFVGRLKKEKGLPELIEAFQSVETTSSIKLIIVGTDEDNLSPLFEHTSNIDYLGFKSNISDYYSLADILCLPSHREGFNNVVLEAASCTLPSIASNIYGLSDAILDGHSGYLHQVKNPKAIKHCMEKVLNDLDGLPQLRNNARSHIEQKFDEKILLKAFIAFYEGYLQKIQNKGK